jgi:hypothetical protein
MSRRTLLASLVAIIVIIFLSYKTDIFYSKVNGIFDIFGERRGQVLHLFHYVGNQLDVTKAFRERNYNFEAEDINLSLKESVISHLEGIYNESISEGFIRDDKNNWKPARLKYGSLDDTRVSIKIHGTSVSPWTSAPGFWDRVQSKIFAGDDGGFRLSTGGGAFNIKLKSKEKYLSGVRRLVLLSNYDDWTIVSNTLNRYAASQGLITSHGSLKNLFINGKPIGLYLAYESINKELLERSYRLTNYGEYKSNNVWDKSLGISHTSLTDYTIYDQEQDGMSQVSPIGLSKLERLFLHIDEGNISSAKSLVDLDYMAWVGAFEKIYGTDHSNSGDNRRYYYDPTIGKFRVSFRIEGAPVKLKSQAVANFESSSVLYGGDRLLNLLQSDQTFLDLRNEKLQELLAGKNDIISMVRQDLLKFQPVLDRSIRSTRALEISVTQDLSVLEYNFEKIHEYLSYGRILTSLRKVGTGQELEILNDSYTKSYFHSYRDCSGETHLIGIDLVPASLSSGGEVSGANKTVIAVPSPCISHMTVSKNGKYVDNRNVFINVINEVPPTVSYKDAIVGEYTIDKAESSITFNEGLIKVLSTFQLPRGMTLFIKPGVVIEMSAGVSMIVRGPLIAEGTSTLQITIRPEQGSGFGSFAVLGEPNKPLAVRLNYFNISGGGESWVDGVLFTGQLAMHQTIFIAKNIKVSGSRSDDGLNVKNSSVFIEDSHFFDNVGDQIDLDFVTGEVNRSFFSRTGTVNESDGLDVSGSNILIYDNTFQNFGDKGLSIGEQSKVFVVSNNFDNNVLGIALKDGSTACILNNVFTDNNKDVLSYIKKKMYGNPLYDVHYDSQMPTSLAAIRTYEGCSFE